MADFASSLPIRTEAAGDVEIKIVDATITSQKLKVNSDGSIDVNAAITATDLDIRDLAFATDKVDASGSTVELGSTTLAALESISATVTATDLDIRDLAFATDKVDVSGSSIVVDQADPGTPFTVELNSVNGNALNLGQQLSTASLPVVISSDQSAIPVSATNLDIRDLAFATDSVDVSGSSISVSGSVTVTATDLDIRNLSASQDSVAIKDSTGNAFTTSNPLPVVLTSSTPGDEVLDYATAASVAAGATTTHTYTVTTGKVLTLQQVSASATGKIKVEIKLNTATKVVKFNSTANTNVDHSFNSPQNLAAATTVQVVITNLDKQAMDIYSTIEGVEN
jgi:hypothetical protein